MTFHCFIENICQNVSRWNDLKKIISSLEKSNFLVARSGFPREMPNLKAETPLTIN